MTALPDWFVYVLLGYGVFCCAVGGIIGTFAERTKQEMKRLAKECDKHDKEPA